MLGIFSVITWDPNLNKPSINRSHHVRPHTHLLIRWMRMSQKKNRLTAITCLGEPKVETTEALEVDNLPEVVMLREEMIQALPVLLHPMVTDPMPHPPIWETSFAVASATGVEKWRTSTIDDMRPWTSLSRSVTLLRSLLIGPRSQRNLELTPTRHLKDTQCFRHDVEIMQDYFRDSLVKDIDKVSLVIHLLRDNAKQSYTAIHLHMNKDAAKRHWIKFDPKNQLRTWEVFRKHLEGSFGSDTDTNGALREWSQLYMKDGKVDCFIDQLFHLAAVLGYSGVFVKDRAPMGMTDLLNTAWSMKTRHPVAYMHYLDLVGQTGHQLEDPSNSLYTGTTGATPLKAYKDRRQA